MMESVQKKMRKQKSQKDDEEQIAKYRQLFIQVIQDKEKKGKENDMEMEIKGSRVRIRY